MHNPHHSLHYLHVGGTHNEQMYANVRDGYNGKHFYVYSFLYSDPILGEPSTHKVSDRTISILLAVKDEIMDVLLKINPLCSLRLQDTVFAKKVNNTRYEVKRHEVPYRVEEF